MRLAERGGEKIEGRHRDRLAVVYVRQSSRQQVADHGESTRLQYGLAERAVALGWPAARVLVIDEDLGRSAANAAARPGFARLVAELTMGHVGLVLGLEMSRLARSGRDWYQLIELCCLAGAAAGRSAAGPAEPRRGDTGCRWVPWTAARRARPAAKSPAIGRPTWPTPATAKRPVRPAPAARTGRRPASEPLRGGLAPGVEAAAIGVPNASGIDPQPTSITPTRRINIDLPRPFGFSNEGG
jgi:hypothetical protein